MPKQLLLVALIALAALVALKLLVLLLEPSLAFYPQRGLDVTPRQYGIAFQEVALETDDGETVHLWHLPHPDPRGRVLYFHGNGGNLSIWAEILVGIWRRGFEVTALDYRGYGKSTGRPSERGLYRDVRAAVLWFSDPARARDEGPDHADVERTGDTAVETPPGHGRRLMPAIYWGRSLGAVMAAYASTVTEPDGLILESGFPDVRTLLDDLPLAYKLLGLFSSYRFPTDAFLRGGSRPVLVLHGDADGVIPLRQGERLLAGINSEKLFHRISGGDHNDASPSDPGPYWSAIDELTTRAQRRADPVR